MQKLIELSLDDLEEDDVVVKKDRRGENKNPFATGSNDSLVKGKRKRDKPDGMDELEYELKSVAKPPQPPSAKDLLGEEALSIDDFLSRQISVNAKMNDRIKSTLQRFDNTYGKQTNTNIIISENNSSGEDNNET